MNKVYLMWLKSKGKREYVAAPNYNKAKRLFAEHTGTKKYITQKISGKVLLNEKPVSSADYLTTDREQGIIKDFTQKFFEGDKNNLTSLEKKIKDYIDRRIEKKIEDYFDNKIPDFKEEN